MQKYVLDLIKEKDELDKKINNLSVFMNSLSFEGLNEAVQDVIKVQHSTMCSYSNVLKIRIKLGKGDSNGR